MADFSSFQNGKSIVKQNKLALIAGPSSDGSLRQHTDGIVNELGLRYSENRLYNDTVQKNGKCNQWKLVPDGKIEVSLISQNLSCRNGIFDCSYLGEKKSYNTYNFKMIGLDCQAKLILVNEKLSSSWAMRQISIGTTHMYAHLKPGGCIQITYWK